MKFITIAASASVLAASLMPMSVAAQAAPLNPSTSAVALASPEKPSTPNEPDEANTPAVTPPNQESSSNDSVEASATVSAGGSIISGIFYNRIQIDIGGARFVGNGGGLMTPGAGTLMGDIYTDDLDRLLRDTASYEVNATPVYVNVNFFDSNSTFLGSLHSGAVSTVTGIGGGVGSWVTR